MSYVLKALQAELIHAENEALEIAQLLAKIERERAELVSRDINAQVKIGELRAEIAAKRSRSFGFKTNYGEFAPVFRSSIDGKK